MTLAGNPAGVFCCQPEEAAMIQKGTIKGFFGNWRSGVAYFIIEDERGFCSEVFCDNAETVRSLSSVFEDVIGPGHVVNQKAILGKEIYYGYDEQGLVMDWFCPVIEASSELMYAYDLQEEGHV
jgi:hypothetical protein